jgi:predicted CXXCH cytochrome family protein
MGVDLKITCGSCHVEHSGRLADLTQMPSDRCTGCHDMAPFEEEHPQFSLVADADAARKAKYASGVEVFHSIHMEMDVPTGDREDEPFHCLDCHGLDPMGGEGFTKPTYERSCSFCHELETPHKSLPQTSWADVRGNLPEGVDPNLALVTDARWRAFEDSGASEEHLEALAEARETMVDDGLEECFRCHSFVDREIDDEPHAVVPQLQHRRQWFRWVRFSHSAHTFLDCRHCHQLAEDSDEELGHLMLPGQENCAACHRQGGASSACSTCHTFHERVPRYEPDPARQKRVQDIWRLQPGT